MTAVDLAVLGLAAAFQLAAAARAFYLVKTTGRRWSWVAVAVALLLMEVRRLMAFSGGSVPPVGVYDVVGLAVSALLLGGVWGIGDFFSEISRSEERLQASQARYRALLEQSTEGFFLLEPSSLLVREANRRLLELTGFTEAEIVGRPLASLLAGDGDDTARTATRIVDGTETLVGEGQCRRKDGSLLDVEISKGMVRFGREGNILVNVRDVSERNRLRALAASAHSTRSLELVFSGLRDSFGNPLNTARVTLGVLRSGWNAADDERRLEYLERIGLQLSRMEELIRVLGSFFGRDRPAVVVFDLVPLVSTAVDMFRTEPASLRVLWTVRVPGEPLPVRGDPNSLLVAFGNVLSNALDALEEGADPAIEVSVSGDGSRATLSVRDNGCGIGASEMASLFHPFYSTRKGRLGLGLVKARKMLTDMGGTISVESAPAAGTTVTFVLPLSGEAA